MAMIQTDGLFYTIVSARHKAVTHLICGKIHNKHVSDTIWKWKIKSSNQK